MQKLAAFAVAMCMMVAMASAQTTEQTVLNFEQPVYMGTVGALKTVKLEVHVAPNDTLFFSRHAIRYDETRIRLVDIQNGADVPGYSLLPFVNWDGFLDGDVIWLGQFFKLGGPPYDQWDGHMFDLTFELVGLNTAGTYVDWTENLQTSGCGTNYLDMFPFVCVGVARYAACCVPCGWAGCVNHCDICIFGRDFTGTTFKISRNAEGPQIVKPAARDRAIEEFNVKQEARLAALAPEMRKFIRKALAGDAIQKPELAAAVTAQRSWYEAKALYRE